MEYFSRSSIYADSCRSWIEKCSTKEELQKKVMQKFKVKSKRDKGYESIRKAVKREWDKKIEEKMKESKKGKVGQKRWDKEDSEENEEEEDFENSELEGEESESEEELKNIKGKFSFYGGTRGGTRKVGQEWDKRFRGGTTCENK